MDFRNIRSSVVVSFPDGLVELLVNNEQKLPGILSRSSAAATTTHGLFAVMLRFVMAERVTHTLMEREKKQGIPTKPMQVENDWSESAKEFFPCLKIFPFTSLAPRNRCI